LNKQIAAELGISERTVKVHRAQVMTKMRARSLAELVHLADKMRAGDL
jgi:FixJ family two-component response regulator